MASSPRSTADVLDEIERLEQSITRTLQEIDQSFSDCQIIVSSKILPQIDRYAETSQGVWEHARLWLNFFEAASTTAAPTVGPRAQAVKDARNKQQTEMKLGDTQSEPTTPEYADTSVPRSPGYDNLDNSTNRQRIDLSSSRLSLDSLGSLRLGSMPSTPTPGRNGRKISQYLGDIVPPAGINWPDLQSSDNAHSTPTRQPYKFNTTAAEKESTTPSVTPMDRHQSISTYTQPNPPHTPLGNRRQSHQGTNHPRRSQDGGFVEIGLEEDHQDVITPPSTLHFSIPESKLATTPRSVVVKSRIDTIHMKEGLIVPQPIFVNDDDGDDALIVDSYVGGSISESGIGGSKKRSREGDLHDPEEDDPNSRPNGWASLTDQQRNIERLLKSPRKMASVQDFFAPSQTQAAAASSSSSSSSKSASDTGKKQQGEESEDTNGDSQSPSRDLISQIEAQADQTEEDPLIAALATPPETRKAIMDRKARDSLLPQLHATSSTISSSSSSSLLSKVSAPIFSMPGLTRSTSGTTSNTTAVSTTSVQESLLTTVPTGTNGADSSAGRSTSSMIGATFMESFNSAFAATSNRRQTMATPIARSNIFSSASLGQYSRNSIGPGYRPNLTSAPFGSPRSAGSTNSRLSLLGSTRRHPVEPTSAGKVAASIIASAAAATSSSSNSSTSSQANELNGSTRQTSQSGLDKFTFGAGSNTTATGILSTPVVSTTSMLAQGQGYPSISSSTGPAGQASNAPDSDFPSGGFLTPFTNRNPPPAPRLGYHSDTIMTQSSLGLNHDGFGFDSEDRTRTTMTSGISDGIGSGNSSGSGGIGTSSVHNGGAISSRQSGVHSIAVATGASRGQRERPVGQVGYGENVEDEEDVTEHIMKSPCPPGKTFYGSNTDLRSVAQAAASARMNNSQSGGSSLFRRQ
ncbi:DASH complex subunit ask1 [Mortierella sp. AD011]|nr:DASH complex subunit ask1 [Mortierella sp. AD010]KAF9403872.1 DASH complex subunit ask1 [Mortierella sp. AD011]